jgi:N utilization substance protein A
MEALDVDDVIAQFLVAEGFTSLEQVAFVPVQELADIEGFDEEVAEELRARARTFLEERDRKNEERRRELGVTDEVAAIEGLSLAALVLLGEKDVKTLDDFADLASDELVEILGAEAPDMETANAMIMAARAHWFEGEEGETAEGETAEGETAEGETGRDEGEKAGEAPAAESAEASPEQ